MMDMLAHLQWRQLSWLWLALAPWLLWLARALVSGSRGREYADAALLPWARAETSVYLQLRRLWRHGVLTLAWLLFAMALAGPRLAQSEYAQDKQYYTELMVVLDVSRSMTARDVAPGRLQRAKLELTDLVNRQQRLKTGLVVYAARPHLLTPPTDDKAVLRHDLQQVRYGLLPSEGSALPAALVFAAGQFGSGKGARAVLVVSDGELPGENAASRAELDAAVAELTARGISIYALGIGTPEGAALQGPRGDWLHHDGRPVLAQLQEARLQGLADRGGGVYARVADTDAEWQALYERSIRFLRGAGYSETGERLIRWRELYAWCLAPALLLLLLAQLQGRAMLPRTAMSVLVCSLALVLLHPPAAQADDTAWQQQAWRAWQAGAWQQARQAYARIDGYAGRMGEGGSAYQLELYAEAVQQFTQAVLAANSDEQRARAVFNLANSHYRQQSYHTAAQLYQEVLRYAPADQAAKVNLELAMVMAKDPQQQARLRGKQGRGLRSKVFEQGTDVTTGSVSVDEDQRSETAANFAAAGPGGDIIEGGISASPAADGRPGDVPDTTWDYALTDPQQIVREASTREVDESQLWQRIFETEEGFSSPVPTPRQQEGMLPW